MISISDGDFYHRRSKVLQKREILAVPVPVDAPLSSVLAIPIIVWAHFSTKWDQLSWKLRFAKCIHINQELVWALKEALFHRECYILAENRSFVNNKHGVGLVCVQSSDWPIIKIEPIGDSLLSKPLTTCVLQVASLELISRNLLLFLRSIETEYPNGRDRKEIEEVLIGREEAINYLPIWLTRRMVGFGGYVCLFMFLINGTTKKKEEEIKIKKTKKKNIIKKKKT